MTTQTTALSAIVVTPEGNMIKMPLMALVTNPAVVPAMAWMDEEMDTLTTWGVPDVQAAKKKKEEEEDEEDDEPVVEGEDEDDDWEKGEEDEEEAWDPDFDEFDLPKSGKKAGKGSEEEDDDLKIDEDLNEFDDLFGDGGGDFDDDDDF